MGKTKQLARRAPVTKRAGSGPRKQRRERTIYDPLCLDPFPHPPDKDIREEMCYVQHLDGTRKVGPLRRCQAEWALKQLAHPESVQIIPA